MGQSTSTVSLDLSPDAVANSIATVKLTLAGSAMGISTMSSASLSTSAANYASWAVAQTPPVTGGPNHVGPDGVSNLLLYALDLKLDGSNASAGTLADNTLTFHKRADAVANGDVSYTIQASNDLGLADPWHKVAPTTDTPTELTYLLPAGSGTSKLFVRLVVTQGPYAGP